MRIWISNTKQGPSRIRTDRLSVFLSVVLGGVIALLMFALKSYFLSAGIVDYPIKSFIKSSTVQPTVTHRNFGWPVLQYWAAGSGFSISLNNSTLGGRQNRDVWLFMAEASNHGVMEFLNHGVTSNTVSNRTEEKRSAPNFRWVRAGYIEGVVADAEIVLRFSYAQDATFFTEIAALAVAPAGLSPSEFERARNGSPCDPVSFVVILLVLILLLGLVVRYLVRTCVKTISHRQYVFAIVSATFVALMFAFAVGSMSERLGRSGLDSILNRTSDHLLRSVADRAKYVMPSRAIQDDVPPELRRNEGILRSEVYYKAASENKRVVTDSLFDKRFRTIKEIEPNYFDAIVAVLVGIFLLGVAASLIVRSRVPAIVGLVAVSILSVFLSIRLSQGWDELFINLRHPYMLIEAGRFSINAKQMIEGTVDLLPLAAAAALSFVGFSLVGALVFLTLMGNVALVLVTYSLSYRATASRAWSLICALILGCYPNVLWVGGTGFTATIFASWMFWGAYFYLFTQRRRLGLFLLATLTLVRMEGVMFAAALVVFDALLAFVSTRMDRASLRRGCLRAGADLSWAVAPFMVSCAIRFHFFHAAFPTPVMQKSAGLDVSYFREGITGLRTMIDTHDIMLSLLIVFAFFIIAWVWSVRLHRGAVVLLSVCGICILPYYVSGGDWFPSYWNRYSMPFTLALTLFVLISAPGVLRTAWAGRSRFFISSLVISTFAICYVQSLQFRANNVWALSYGEARRTAGERWQRVDYLAALGDFLRRTTPSNAVIASSEIATIMFYAKREMVDLLGVANPQIAAMPLQPFLSGDPLHRRRSIEALAKQSPDVVAMFEPVGFIDPNVQGDRLNAIRIAAEDRLFRQRMIDISYYRIGSYHTIEQLGYRHYIVWAGDIFFSLFIHARIDADFRTALIKEGVNSIGNLEFPYRIDPRLTALYLPAAAGTKLESLGR